MIDMDECFFKIRLFNHTDLDKIIIIENKSFPERHRYDKTTFKRLFRENPDSFLVAEYCSEVIGYVIASRIEDFGHIISIAIHPDYRGRGFGSKLLNAIEEKLIEKGVRVITLEVGVNNKVAISMYRKHGYEPVKILEKYYGEEDALLMVKNIERNEFKGD